MKYWDINIAVVFRLMTLSQTQVCFAVTNFKTLLCYLKDTQGSLQKAVAYMANAENDRTWQKYLAVHSLKNNHVQVSPFTWEKN